MKYEEMAVILGQAYRPFKNIQLSEDDVRGWYTLFGREAPADFFAALSAAIQEPGREFFPTPGVVRKYFKKAKMSGEEVWIELTELAKRGQGIQALNEKYGEDSLVMKAVRSVGWDRVRYADLEVEMPFVRKNFMEAYESIGETFEHDSRVQIGREEARSLLANLWDVKAIGE